MKLQKFVVLIVVLMMLAGLTVYIALDSEMFEKDEQVQTVNEVSNSVNNK